MLNKLSKSVLFLSKGTINLKTLSSNSLLSGSLLMLIGSLGANAVNYIYHLLMGRILGPVEYGKLAAIFSLLYIISVIPISSSFAIVKFISVSKTKKERDVFYTSIRKFFISFGLVVSILWLLASGVIADFLHIDETPSILMVSAVLFINLVVLVNQATSQGMLNFKGVVWPNMTASLGKLILGILAVYLGLSVNGAIFAVVVGAVLAYFHSEIYIKSLKVKVSGVSKPDLKPFFVYALPVLLQALAFTSIFTIDLIFVKHFLPEFDAGLYAALSTLGKIIYFAVSPVSSVMFPVVAGRRSKGEKYRNVFYISLFATAIVSIIVVIFYYLFPGLAIGLLYGGAYLSAKTDLVWMGVFMTLYSLSNFIVSFLLSIHRVKIVILPFIISVAQVVLIWFYHESIRQILQINVILTTILLIGLVLYMIISELKRQSNEEKTK